MLIALRFNLRVDYNIKLPQNKAQTNIAASSKAEASSSFKGFGFFKTLNTTWFNNLPLFVEDKSLILVLFLQQNFEQYIELLIFCQHTDKQLKLKTFNIRTKLHVTHVFNTMKNRTSNTKLQTQHISPLFVFTNRQR